MEGASEMIELKVNDSVGIPGRYFVEFRHVTKLGKRRELYDRCPVKAVTTCAIYAEGGFIAIGNAICANDDNFSRREGRLKAFDKALRHCGAFNGIKAALTEAYLQVDPDPPIIQRGQLSPEEIEQRRAAGAGIYAERQARHGLKD
jgi:hypothetical protein